MTTITGIASGDRVRPGSRKAGSETSFPVLQRSRAHRKYSAAAVVDAATVDAAAICDGQPRDAHRPGINLEHLHHVSAGDGEQLGDRADVDNDGAPERAAGVQIFSVTHELDVIPALAGQLSEVMEPAIFVSETTALRCWRPVFRSPIGDIP